MFKVTNVSTGKYKFGFFITGASIIGLMFQMETVNNLNDDMVSLIYKLLSLVTSGIFLITNIRYLVMLDTMKRHAKAGLASPEKMRDNEWKKKCIELSKTAFDLKTFYMCSITSFIVSIFMAKTGSPDIGVGIMLVNVVAFLHLQHSTFNITKLISKEIK